MALTNKMLKAMGLEDAQIEQIIEAHRDTINGLTDTRDKLQEELDKANAEVKRLAIVEKELAKANAKLEEAQETEQKLNDLKKEYNDFKAEIDAKDVKENKTKAYKELLSKSGIPEKYHEAIVRVTDFDKVEMKEGKIANEKDLTDAILTDWSDFKVTESKQGARTPNPPASNGGETFEKMSLADKMAYANENPNAEEVKAWLK